MERLPRLLVEFLGTFERLPVQENAVGIRNPDFDGSRRRPRPGGEHVVADDPGIALLEDGFPCQFGQVVADVVERVFVFDLHDFERAPLLEQFDPMPRQIPPIVA